MIRKFLYALLRFSILPLLALVLLELDITIHKKGLLSEKKLEKIFQNSGTTYRWVTQVRHTNKVLLLGSSSIKYGLSCTLLNKLSNDSLSFINLAADARDPVETYFILKHTDLTNVTKVYYGIDPWIFVKTYYKNRNSYLYLDMDLMTAGRYSLEHDPQFFPKRYKALFNSWVSTSTLNASTGQPIPPDFGSATLDKVPTNFDDPVHKKFQLEKYGWSNLQFEYLQKIVQLCNSKTISFIAFYPPRRSDFITDYHQNCAAIHIAFLEKLKATGFSTPIIGSHDQLRSYGDGIFADAYHLNGKGQKIYSPVFLLK
ncbi:MAG TPA: hypothetical protein VMZ03_00640 [Chitinophagaceae bacterium]|nr:hypothetical protein [Chitinophagaceae bacterium]